MPAVARYLKRQFARYIDSTAGYSLHITYKSFPGMNVQYLEGDRQVNVSAEINHNLTDLRLLFTTADHWDAPHDTDAIDAGHQAVMRERILAGLGHLGYGVIPVEA